MAQYKYRAQITQHITPANNSKFYRHVIRTAQPGSFFFTPIILIANIDAHDFEQILIRSMHYFALNDPHAFPNHVPSIVTTLKSATHRNTKRKTKQRKRTQKRHSQRLHTALTSTQKTPTFTFIPITPQLFRVHTERCFYYRLSSLLQNNLHKVIAVHFYPGRPHTNTYHTYHTFGPTLITICDRVYTLWEALNSLLKPSFSGRFLLLPVRRRTLNERLLRRLGRPLLYPITTITSIAPHFNALHWLSFFRNTHKFADRKMATIARKHIKSFLFKSYQITTKQIVTGLHTNIVLHHHPNTQTHTARSCQQLILSAHAREHPQLSNLFPTKSFLTIKRNKTLGELLFNYRSITDSFDPANPPPCLTPKRCKHGHFLLLPYELDRQTAELLRNINAPAFLSSPNNVAEITTAFIDLLQRIRTFLPLLHDNTHTYTLRNTTRTH
jgi:hypothetical protein